MGVESLTLNLSKENHATSFCWVEKGSDLLTPLADVIKLFLKISIAVTHLRHSFQKL
jgi:hypothetical protein